MCLQGSLADVYETDISTALHVLLAQGEDATYMTALLYLVFSSIFRFGKSKNISTTITARCELVMDLSLLLRITGLQ